MGGGIFGSTTQPSWRGRAPQRCPTKIEDPYREYVVKESKWLDVFMARELDPPPPPNTYDVTPPNSRPNTSTPHFASTTLQRNHGEEGTGGAVGCVPCGPTERVPENAETKMENRARATAIVAAAARERLARSGVNEFGVADTGAGCVVDNASATKAWQANKTIREANVFVTIRKKQAVDSARRRAAAVANTKRNTLARDTNKPTRPSSKRFDAVVKPVTAASRPYHVSSKPKTATSAAADIEITTKRTGEPGEQSRALVLNLDHLENSSIEVLLHEVRSAEKARLNGEEFVLETYEKTREALARKERL